MTNDLSLEPLKRPGQSAGLIEVVRQPYLTSLIVHKELRQRYRGSVLGMLWSYAKPATQFLVFYFAIGVFMGMNRQIDHYVIYMFSGVVLMNYFTEILGNATHSVVWNAPLVRKIYFPRELFPVSSLWVGLVHFLPQILILLVASLFFGWVPTPWSILAILVAFVIVTLFALGVGLFTGAVNVFYRDSENFVDLVLILITWISPVLYTWEMVYRVLGDKAKGIFWVIYQLNPLTVAIELFHAGFWQATLPAGQVQALPSQWQIWVPVALIISVVVLVLGDLFFHRVEPRFAQEL